MPKVVKPDELSNYIGTELGISDWFEIDQDRINSFANCSNDHQWIHVDEQKAKDGPFGATIAHGYLTLSLISGLSGAIMIVPEGIKMGINYGLNRVRFLEPVKVGSKIRNKRVLKDVTDKGDGRFLMTIENTMEIEGIEKPALIAETLSLLIT
ncbi:MAG: MaoC family dehydratase [Spirochaetota bacterium]|nr:MaoC family dehydratase [Spirochaetota bacterium]